VVARATAQVAGQGTPDLGFAGVCVLAEQRHDGHDDSGRAEPALEAVLLMKCLLDGMERFAVRRQALDRFD
jgi:hypothetical protein